jgi:hypothetical protein
VKAVRAASVSEVLARKSRQRQRRTMVDDGIRRVDQRVCRVQTSIAEVAILRRPKRRIEPIDRAEEFRRQREVVRRKELERAARREKVRAGRFDDPLTGRRTDVAGQCVRRAAANECPRCAARHNDADTGQ